MPVIGRRSRLTLALMETWAKTRVKKPKEKSLAKLLSVLAAIEPIRDIRNENRMISVIIPAKPNFLAKLARAKSLYGSGTSALWDAFLSNAMPNHWPDPIAVFACKIL